MVKSCVYCFAERTIARQTYMQSKLWKPFNVGFLFVIGLPRPNETNIFNFNQYKITLKSNSWILSNKSDWSRFETIQKLSIESKQFDDLLVGSFHDTYYNLTLKMIMSMRWLDKFCQDQSLAYIFIDGDYGIYPKNLINYLKKFKIEKLKNLAHGSVHATRMVIRPIKNKIDQNKWMVDYDDYRFKLYPKYFHGLMYLIGSNLISNISLAMGFTKYIRIDDVFLGMVLQNIQISIDHVPEICFATTKSNFKNQLNFPIKSAHDLINWTTGVSKS